MTSCRLGISVSEFNEKFSRHNQKDDCDHTGFLTQPDKHSVVSGARRRKLAWNLPFTYHDDIQNAFNFPSTAPILFNIMVLRGRSKIKCYLLLVITIISPSFTPAGTSAITY